MKHEMMVVMLLVAMAALGLEGLDEVALIPESRLDGDLGDELVCGDERWTAMQKCEFVAWFSRQKCAQTGWYSDENVLDCLPFHGVIYE